jgi:bacterial/archaeal transporter family protein
VSSWLFWALLSATFAALTALLAKIGVAEINPDAATLIRSGVVVIVLTILIGASGQLQGLTHASVRTYLWLASSGMATGASWLCYFRALHHGDAARVASIDKLSVVLLACFSVVFLGERLSVLNWLGVALVAAGAWLITVR